jgi:hypothetical protein
MAIVNRVAGPGFASVNPQRRNSIKGGQKIESSKNAAGERTYRIGK